jgi:hypothetical protein
MFHVEQQREEKKRAKKGREVRHRREDGAIVRQKPGGGEMFHVEQSGEVGASPLPRFLRHPCRDGNARCALPSTPRRIASLLHNKNSAEKNSAEPKA